VHWPGSDLAIPVLIGVFTLVTAGAVSLLKSQSPAGAAMAELGPAGADRRPVS